MCVLVDSEIRLLGGAECRIVPYNEEQVNPASYDLTLGGGYIDQYTGKHGYNDEITLYPPSDLYSLVYSLRSLMHKTFPRLFSQPVHRPSAILATTEECVSIPNDMVGNVLLKSSLARHGLDHALAGFIDPGFVGQITLELHVHRKITLRRGQRICQIVFTRTTREPDKPYNGNYQNQVGVVKSVLDGGGTK